MNNIIKLFVLLLSIYGIFNMELFSKSLNETSKELVVKFDKNIIEIQPGIDTVGKEGIILKESISGKILINSSFKCIVRAFKNKNLTDSISINEFGDTVLRPRFESYYKIIFSDSTFRNNTYRNLLEAGEYIDIYKNGTIKTDNIFTNDTLYYRQWNFHDDTVYGINAEGAWKYTFGDPNLIVAVIDEGVRNDHSDLYPRVFGDNEFAGGHGTKVAGIIGASTNNINLISGLSGNSKIYSGCIYELDYSEVADKIVVAVDIGAGILNNSWAFDPADQFIISVRSSMAYAYKMNRIVVCAKGNDDSSEPHYPSDYGQGIISVGAYGTDGRRAKFSNIGNGIDIVAPGDFITSLDAGSQDDWTRYFGGTSAAAPHAAGVAALLKSYDNTLYNDDIENIINLTAKDNKEDPAVIGYDDYTGWGNLNAKAAFDILQLPNMLAHLEADGGNQYSNTSAMTMVFFDIPNMADGVYIAKRYEVRKSVTFPHSYLESPHAWGRGVAARGYSAANPNFGMNYAGVIPESVTETSCVFRTWVYEIWTVSGTYVGWKPCAPEDVKFAYTVLGEYEVQKPAYFNVNNHFEHQAVRVCWSDPNPYEEGWILERKSATVPVWKVIDTIPNNDYDYVYYDDYYPIGGETYTYRVKPYTADQQNAPYSDEATVTTRPHRAEDIAVYATDFSYGVPTVTGCGDVPLKINTDLISAAKDIAGAPELISEEDENWHLLYGNDITARWIPSPHQKYPIVKYFIRLSHPHVTMGDIYDVGPDTCFYICPVDANSTYSVYVYGISSIGDTSLPDIQKCQHRQYECLPRKCNEKQ